MNARSRGFPLSIRSTSEIAFSTRENRGWIPPFLFSYILFPSFRAHGGTIVSPLEIVRWPAHAGETETKGRNYSSRYFSCCNQSDYVSRGRLTMTFAAPANVENSDECSYARKRERERISPSIYIQGWSGHLVALTAVWNLHDRVTRVRAVFAIMASVQYFVDDSVRQSDCQGSSLWTTSIVRITQFVFLSSRLWSQPRILAFQCYSRNRNRLPWMLEYYIKNLKVYNEKRVRNWGYVHF